MMVQSRPQQNNLAQETKCGKNQSHTLAYSLIGLQEMNLAFKFPIMFWNCACLISDAGGNEADGNGTEDSVGGEYSWSSSEMAEGFVDFTSDEPDEEDDSDDAGEDDGEDAVSESNGTTKPKKKVKATNYGRILQSL